MSFFASAEIPRASAVPSQGPSVQPCDIGGSYSFLPLEEENDCRSNCPLSAPGVPSKICSCGHIQYVPPVVKGSHELIVDLGLGVALSLLGPCNVCFGQ